MRMLNEKSLFERFSVYMFESRGCLAKMACLMLLMVSRTAYAGNTSFFAGDTKVFVEKSELAIKIVRFIAIFIVIGGVIWAGAEFSIKHDQQRGATILVSAVIGGFAVLLAPTLMNFVIGGLDVGDVTAVGN